MGLASILKLARTSPPITHDVRSTMKKLLIGAALVAAGSLCLQEITAGHGGTYRGPGDTVPPGGGGAGGGPASPGSGGPATPGPSGPSTPGPATPGAPAPGPAAGPSPVTGGGGDSGPDLTVWQFWWGFNKEPYLNLKARIHSGGPISGSDDWFLGKGEKDQARDTLRPSEAAIRGKVVPAMIQALKSERSKDIITGCLIGLAKIGDAKSEAGESAMAGHIIPFLGDGNQEISETAAVALGILANEANIDLLTAMLENRPNDVNSLGKASGGTSSLHLTGSIPDRSRAFAAYGLGLIGYKASEEGRKKIVESLVKMVDGEARKMGTRDVAVACLTAFGLTPLSISTEATPIDPKNLVKPEKVNTRQDQIQWLLTAFDDLQGLNFLVRAHAPTAMGRLLADAPNDSPLRKVVADRLLSDIVKLSKAQKEIQQSCIQALGMIGDCDADKLDADIREGLMAVKDELPDIQSRNFALIALAQVCGRPGTGQGDPIAGVNPKDKKNARAFLLDQLGKGKTQAKPWAGIAIGVLERALDDSKQPSSTDAKIALKNELRDSKTPQEVGAFAIGLGIARVSDAQVELREKLEKISDNDARGYVAVALGLIGDRDSIIKIEEIVRKSKYQPDLLKQAAIGLGLLGDKAIVNDLITMLNEASGLSSQAAISSALGFIGDARSIDPLIALLNDKQKTDLARGFAAVALGIVADKEDLPWNTKISVNINYRASTPTLTSPDVGTGILDIL
jgi:HEAT repeat protein